MGLSEYAVHRHWQHGASKMSRMLRSNEGHWGSSTDNAAAEDILPQDDLEGVARVEVRRTEVEGRMAGRAERNEWIIVLW